jgi:mono/diheme cytochrome c family protein
MRLTWVIAASGAAADKCPMSDRIVTRLLRPLLLAILLAPCIAGTAARADDIGDPVAGHRLAMAWCSNCHAIPGNDRAIATGAPTFSAIAANHAMTPLALRAFLQTPHDRMPDLHLSNGEMDDLISFVLARPR